MFPSLLSHELARAHQADLRREAVLTGPRRRRDLPLAGTVAAAVHRVTAAIAGLRPVAPPQACVTC